NQRRCARAARALAPAGHAQGGVSRSELSLLSRGDRVRVRLDKPAGPGPHPVLIALGLERDTAHAGFAVVSFDLPLCGARASGKMSPQVLERLRPDLERQTRADVDAVLAQLAHDRELDLAKLTLIGVGRAAELAQGLASDPRFVRVRLEPGARVLDP